MLNAACRAQQLLDGKLNVVAQKRLVTKPWDKMLFDMRMELGKGHYENLSIQYTENFVTIKYKKNHWKSSYNFKMFAQNIYCGYTLKPPRRGGSIIAGKIAAHSAYDMFHGISA